MTTELEARGSPATARRLEHRTRRAGSALAAADAVLRAAIDNDDVARIARRIPPPAQP
jgi:hypothetical protein